MTRSCMETGECELVVERDNGGAFMVWERTSSLYEKYEKHEQTLYVSDVRCEE